MLDATFQWLLAQRPVASVIAGATLASQVTQNAAVGAAVVGADVLRAVGSLFAAR